MHFGYGLHFTFEAEQGDLLDDPKDAVRRLASLGGGTLTDDKGNVLLEIPDGSRLLSLRRSRSKSADRPDPPPPPPLGATSASAKRTS